MREDRNSGTVMFVIALAALTVAALAISINSPAVTGSEPGSWAVKAGDNLTYEVSGHRDEGPVTGMAYANFTEVNIIGNIMAISGHYSTDLGDLTGPGVISALSSPSMGSCVGQQVISTTFGDKHVTRYIDFRTDPEANATTLIVVYAGVESRIIYRINVSGPSFFLSLDLTDSTVHGMEDLDLKSITHLTLTTYRPQESWVMNYNGRGASTGVWDLPDGTRFDLSLDGNGSTFLMFNETNLYNMEHGSVLEYVPELSVINPPGVRSNVLDGGVYMVVTISGHNDTREEFVLTYPS